ncbi:CHAT domain-containing protein [Actinosynnema sp. CA-299493]
MQELTSSASSDRVARTCENCGVPMLLPEPVTLIDYAVDTDHLDALAFDTLNKVRHFCGHVTTVDARISVHGLGEVPVVLDPDAESGATPGVTPQADMFRAYVLQRLLGDADVHIRGAYADDWAPLEVSRAALLGMRMGFIRDEGSAEAVADVVVAVIVAHATEVARSSTLPRLADRLRSAVPVQALFPHVLSALARGCEGEYFNWHMEYVCAVAHALAGIPNPRAGDWAGLLVYMWAQRELGLQDFDDAFFLDAEALQFSTGFDTLFKAAVDALDSRGKGQLEELGNRFGGLFERAGWRSLLSVKLSQARARTFVGVETDSTPEEGMHDLIAWMVEEDAPTDEWISFLAETFGQWVDAGQPVELVLRYADALAAETGPSEVAVFVTYCGAALDRSGWSDAALRLLGWWEALEVDVADLPTLVRAELHFATGLIRSRNSPAVALDEYAKAELASAPLPDADVRSEQIRRRSASALRALRRYGEAFGLFEGLGDDPEVLQTRALMHLDIGEWEPALDALDRALLHEIADPGRVRLLVLRAVVLHELDRALEGLPGLAAAWGLCSGISLPLEEPSVAAQVIRIADPPKEFAAFAAQCARELDQLEPHRLDPGERLSMVGSLVDRALGSGDVTGARGALERWLGDFLEVDRMDAGAAALWARVVAAEGGDPWPFLRRVVESLNESVPAGVDARFARGWLSKQRDAIDHALAVAAETGGSAVDLLAVHEVANSRDLVTGSAADLLPQVRGQDVVAVLDGVSVLRLVVIPGDEVREPAVVTVAATSEEVATAVAQVAAYDSANPVAPHRTDAQVTVWWDLAGRIARGLRPHLSPGLPLVLLPGRRLATTPLHAAGWPDQPLVAERPVVLSPNLHTYLTPVPVRTTTRTKVIAVPNDLDAPWFVEGLTAAAVELTGGGEAPITNTDAIADTVLTACATADEVYFLCHGYQGPNGPGFCVAAHGLLPPKKLLVELDPDLGDFLIDWSRLAALDPAPAVLVTIACATGRTHIGPGGLRSGLERGHLFSGGHTLISPLWNVDQEAALTWLHAFHEHHEPGSVDDLAESHRIATLHTMKQHGSPHAWAPFTMTTRTGGVR